MSRDVFMSLLALDAYNREYDQSLFVNGNAVGRARVLDRNELDLGTSKFAEWQAAGFYAIAYQLPDEVVISYRGTSFNNGFDETTLLDVTNGWITGAGLTGSLASAIDGALP